MSAPYKGRTCGVGFSFLKLNAECQANRQSKSWPSISLKRALKFNCLSARAGGVPRFQFVVATFIRLPLGKISRTETNNSVHIVRRPTHVHPLRIKEASPDAKDTLCYESQPRYRVLYYHRPDCTGSLLRLFRFILLRTTRRSEQLPFSTYF